MTQALINSTDIIQNSGFLDTAVNSSVAVTSEVAADKTAVSEFGEIFDKTLLLQQDTTAESDIIPVDDRDMSIEVPDLYEIIVQAIEEVSVEKSLDLTLAKDIAATINSIKLSSDTESEVIPEQDTGDEFLPGENREYNIRPDVKADNDDKMVRDKDDTPVFEQILTFVNNTNDSVQNKNVTVENTVNSEKFSQDNTSQIVYKEKDYELRDTQERSDNNEQELDKDMLDSLHIESISAEAENYEGESMANQDSPEEFGVKVMLNHSLDKTEAAFSKIVAQESAKPVNITPEKVIEQITKHMDALKNNSGVKIVLNPESLGKLNLQILTTKDGLSAQFTVTSNEARDLLMKGLDGLKETLLTQGIGVDNISVKVTEAEESSYNQDWTDKENSEGGHREQQKQNREEKEKGLFEKTIAESLNKENGKV